MENRIPGRPKWVSKPLYAMLCEEFPAHRTPLEILDVQRLRKDLNVSHEAVYKWLRASKLSPTNAKMIVEVAHSVENKRALKKVGRTPSPLKDYAKFVFA